MRDKGYDLKLMYREKSSPEIQLNFGESFSYLEKRRLAMTYSQIWNNSGNEAEILYLEQQIEAIKKEIKRAKAAEQQEILDQANLKLTELEAKLDELEE